MNSIEKSLAVLRALSTPNHPHRLAELAEQTGLNKPSVHRILQVLVANNYAQARGDGLYGPGAATRALVGHGDCHDDLAASADQILTELQLSTGHTVHFAVRAGDAAIYVAKIEGDKPYQMASRVGMQIQLHCTSIGKAILAALPATEVDAIIDRTSQLEHRAHRLPNLSTVRRQLPEIASAGYSIDDEENEPNIRCVGAAVRDATGSAIGGISISGLAFMLELDRLHQLGGIVSGAADEVSRTIGYSGRVRA